MQTMWLCMVICNKTNRSR